MLLNFKNNLIYTTNDIYICPLKWYCKTINLWFYFIVGTFEKTIINYKKIIYFVLADN